MELSLELLHFMQKLTNPLERYIKNLDYKEYVHKTLELTSKSIDRISEIQTYCIVDWKTLMRKIF